MFKWINIFSLVIVILTLLLHSLWVTAIGLTLATISIVLEMLDV